MALSSAQATAQIAQPAPAPSGSLRQATRRDVAQLANVLASAFNDDPAFEWLLPNERKRPAGLRRYFEMELRAVGLARGSVWTNDELTGAAISTGPGKWRVPPRALALHGPAFTRTFGVRLPRAATLLARVESRHVRGPHHYFAVIGVAPVQQGHGVGRG
jgi:hypothetical protein